MTDTSRDDPQALLTASSNAQTRLAEQFKASLLLPPGDDQVHYQRLDYSQYLDAAGSQLLLSLRATAVIRARVFAWTMAVTLPASATVNAMRWACASQ